MWLLKRLLKLDSSITVGQWIYDRITNNWVSIVSVLGGVAITYLAKITEWLKPWGPIGWGAIGLLSFALIAALIGVTSLTLAYASQKRAEVQVIKKWASDASNVNPLEREFRNVRINIADLANPVTKIISGKRFIGCEIIGPVTFFLGSKCLLRQTYIASGNLIPIKNPFPIYDIYVLLECEFIESQFYSVTILFPLQGIEMLQAGFPHEKLPFLSLTGNPEHDMRPHPALPRNQQFSGLQNPVPPTPPT